MKIPTLKQYLRAQPPPKLKYKYCLTPEQREEIKNLRMDGLKLEWIAMEYDVSITTIQRVINTEYKNGATIAIQKKE